MIFTFESTYIYEDFNGVTYAWCLCTYRTVYVSLVPGSNCECIDGTSTKLWMRCLCVDWCGECLCKTWHWNSFPGTKMFVQATNNKYKYNKGTKMSSTLSNEMFSFRSIDFGLLFQSTRWCEHITFTFLSLFINEHHMIPAVPCTCEAELIFAEPNRCGVVKQETEHRYPMFSSVCGWRFLLQRKVTRGWSWRPVVSMRVRSMLAMLINFS